MKKILKNYLVVLTILSLATMNLFLADIQRADAVASLQNAKDTITDSAPGTTNVTHRIVFQSATSTAANGYFDIIMPAGFTNVLVGGLTCPGTMAESAVGNTLTCTGANAAGWATTTITGVTNPSATTSQVININYYDVAGNLAERVQVVVYIIDNVLMTATVDATLTFIISGTSTGATVNGMTCDATTTATSTPFGTLAVGVKKDICQELRVATNATHGYMVTVEQDNELRNSTNDNINSFIDSPDGSGSTTPASWQAPSGVLDAKETYGHMGLTSEDDSLSTGDAFTPGGNTYYVGLNGYNVTREVMYHTGPADGATLSSGTADKGYTAVMYSAEIMALQEAGDYQTTLTYIATPTY